MSLIPESLLPISPAEEYYDLGEYSRPITCNTKAAQTWFNRGLIWSYSFNHVEAYRCFQQAIVHDRSCAMAYWGLAYAAGPNYNKSWRMFDPVDLEQSIKTCHDAARLALSLSQTNPTTPIEHALIEAMQARFPVDHPVDDFSAWDHAYANAMQKVYDQFGDTDMDVVTLYVDARMHTSQRKMFHAQTGLPIASSPVEEVKRLFHFGLQHPAGEYHPGLIHFSIHFWEMSATPAVALPAADRLRHLVPDAGHIHHMPTHLDVLVGDYRRSIDSNSAAVRADEKYLALNGAKNMYSFYRLHNYHSLVYAAMLSGQSKVALRAIDRMEMSITDEVLQVKSPPLADWLEFFKSLRVHVYTRFGRWEDLKTLPLPHDQDLYCVTTAMTHYGKAIAYAATNDILNAETQRDLYHAAANRVPPTRKDHPNLIINILKVSTAMLDGEIEYRKRNFARAFDHLREAIHHDDSLMYTEPWGWMLPIRHAYAALSLEQGLIEQAAMAYAEDLGLDGGLTRAHQHPNNVWALHGYHECLVRLGREAEARIVKQQLDLAVAVADVDIRSSCFCRLGVMNECCS
ncbi:hypothetical protein ASPWEDRAFT_34296 [Aspergillus wentii DTO 134E9]|uniref:TPR domain protein n=1 Tax=Aspergillus wentii DTO 134E9 TaxID=1073089 RepID=A0A1L9S0Y4_ASPWE|nr:uncharacterized protein ASPWEDRAFT_34296 [Aspergillus wentii DTO 134E9]KAI9931179.1 hypothetical protein MW887_010838 [Aspergillus wentii]OJJ40814.1 hypothetical protein ASPWEDRAFT_34296 [Aspergillus wentii DTO 134E9]